MAEYKYEIWQVKEDFVRDFAFQSWEDLEWQEEKEGIGFRKEHYEKVYEGVYELNDAKSKEAPIMFLLDELFEKFNVDKPADFKHRSMSVSDVVVVNGRAFYCDKFGWKEVDFENVTLGKLQSDLEAEEIEKDFEEEE